MEGREQASFDRKSSHHPDPHPVCQTYPRHSTKTAQTWYDSPPCTSFPAVGVRVMLTALSLSLSLWAPVLTSPSITRVRPSSSPRRFPWLATDTIISRPALLLSDLIMCRRQPGIGE